MADLRSGRPAAAAAAGRTLIPTPAGAGAAHMPSLVAYLGPRTPVYSPSKATSYNLYR
jgi:hypothetical protein